MHTKFHYSLLFFIILVLHIAAGIYVNGYSAWWLAAACTLYLAILVLGSIKIGWNFYFRSVNTLPLLKVQFASGQLSMTQRGQQVALTFDDGPAMPTAAILDILKQAQVQATFFLIGKNIEGNETLVRRMQQEGHAIGGHSFSHGFNFDWQPAAKMQDEIEATNAAITAVTGQEVKLFRPPYGVTNPNLARAVQHSGVRSIGWSLRSLDTVAKTKEDLLSRILDKVKTGDIILLHDRCAVTEAVLPELIQALKKRGFSFATL